MAGIKFDITGDNKNVLQSFNEVQSGVKQMQRQVEDSGASIEDMFKRIGAVAGLTFAGVSAKEFVRNVMNVRGEFQKLEVAFTTMLQSEEKAASLMNQLVKTAAITPFDLKGVADGAKQLLAYGIAADEVNDTLVHLGDIAAGLSIPLGDLVYLYGTTMVQGRMFTQDLRQFQGRGIPIAEELAKQFGVAKDKVGELVTAGKVGAEQVKKAIMDMSSAGGKFGGLMEEQSKTINGQISNIEDAIDVMFNNIGKQSEGIINSTLSVVSTLIENYEAVGKAIGSAVAVYGVYKAAIMTVTALQALQTAGVGALTVAETAHYGWIVLVEKAQKLLNATMLSNPYVLVATAIAGVVAVMMNMKSQQELITEATEEYNRKKDEAIANEEEHRRKIEELLSIAGDEQLSTENRRLALVRLEQQYPSIFAQYDTEAEKLKHILDIKNAIAELDGKKSIKNAGNELDSVNARIKELQAIRVNRFLSEHGGYVTSGRNRTDKENAELTALLKRRDELNNTINKDKANSYLTNLTGISNEELQRQINERRNLLAQMQTTEKKYGRVQAGGAKGIYNADELKGQLQILEAEQNKRKEAKYTPSEQKAQAKKALDEARKALKDFDNSSTKYTVAEAEEARKKLVDAVTEAEKNYKKFGGKTKEKDTSAKTLKEQQKLNELTEKQERERARAIVDMSYSTEQARIDAMEEGTEKTVRQLKLDFERQKTEIERGYEDLKYKKIEEARALFEANPANKNKVFDESTVDTSYSDAETQNYEAQLNANLEQYKRSKTELEQSELQSMRDYLKEYGTFLQQRLALEEEYAEKIRKARTEGEKLTYQAELNRMIGERKATELASGLDFSQLFDGIGNIVQKIAKETFEKVNEYKKTEEYQKLFAENKKAIAELEAKLIEKGGAGSVNPFSSSVWEKIRKTSEKYDNAIKDVTASTNEHTKALKEAKIATKEYEKIMSDVSASPEEKINARLKKAISDQNVIITGRAQKDANDKLVETQNDLTLVSNQAAQGLENFNASISQITSGSLTSFITGLSNLIDVLGGGKGNKGLTESISSLLGSAPNAYAQIIAAILSILEQVGEDSVKPITEFVNNLFEAISNALAEALNGEATYKVMESIGQGISNLIGTIIQGLGDIFSDGGVFLQPTIKTFEGLFNGIVEGWSSTFNPDNHEDMVAIQEEATKYLELINEHVSIIADKMKDSYGAKAIDLYTQAQKTASDQTRYYWQGLNAAGWDNHGERHSYWYHYNKNSGYMADALATMYGLAPSGQGWQSFFQQLADMGAKGAEILDDIRTNHFDYWSAFMLQDNHGDMQKWLTEWADSWQEMEQLEEDFREQMTGTTLDNVFSGFMDDLYEFADGAEDVFDKVGDDFQSMINRMVVNNIMAQNIRNSLSKWYEQFASAYSDKNLTTDELESLRDDYFDIVEGAKAELEGLKAAGLVNPTEATYEQEASSKGFQAMSQDLGEELSGRFTAVQIAGENISAQMLVVVATMNSLAAFSGSTNGAVIEIRNLMIMTNSYLEDVVKYAKLLYNEFGEKLDDIVNNTKNL